MNNDLLAGAEPCMTNEAAHESVRWLHYLDSRRINALSSDLASTYGSYPQAICVAEIINMSCIQTIYGQEAWQHVKMHMQSCITQAFAQNIEVIQVGLSSFAFMVGASDKESLNATLKHLVEALTLMHCPNSEDRVVLAFKVGVANPQGLDLETAIAHAHVAVNHADAHQHDKKIVFVEDTCTQQAEAANTIRLASYLLNAIELGRTALAFQPVIDCKTGKVDKYEGLLRVITEDGVITSAGPFIAAAERLGCIHRIDDMVLEQITAELNADRNVKLGMNISNLSVDNVEWLKKAKTLLQDEQISSRLTIEITETGTHQNLEKMARLVDSLKCLGCNVAIDDFGAGYTSFKQLKMLHADYIKIDGAFIRNIVDDEDNRLFVRTLITFAKSFGIKSVAEFVETGEIAKVLLELGIDYMQGNYFSPAINYRPWSEEDCSTSSHRNG